MDITPQELYHYGIARRSGRYPWGSGENPFQRNGGFMSQYSALREKGMSDADIAKGMGISTRQLLAKKTIELNKERQAKVDAVQKLKDKGWSNSAIAEYTGLNESSVRSLLDKEIQKRQQVLMDRAGIIKKAVDEQSYVDIGEGVEYSLDISRTKFDAAVDVLKEQGYGVHKVYTQTGRNGQKITQLVITKPGVDYKELMANKDKIGSIEQFSDDGGLTFKKPPKPVSVDSKRVEIRYAEEGGIDRDGLVEIRRGTEDLSLGSARYAQVRIAVDGTHYIKGMAVYSDDLPKGVDIRVNSNKRNTGNKLDALKSMKDDPERPFKTVTRPPVSYIDKHGKKRYSPINVVQEEGDWSQWSTRFSSQFLSKQNPRFAKQQLELTHAKKRAEYEEIMSISNKTIRKEMLKEFGDSCDSAATHLKAASLKGTTTKVILPVPDLKPNEVFAPGYKNGTRLALVRHPHGGPFEIPEVVVNNKSLKARKTIPHDALDAIGIHPKVAAKLSGADFDGDTVLAIPNIRKQVVHKKTLKGLEGFEPKAIYKLPHKTEKEAKKDPRYMKDTQKQMGMITNLITDMTVKGASEDKIARAVRHSMVVIDAEKHQLDYKKSYKDNGIKELQDEYQPAARGKKKSGGASTLLSRSKASVYIPEIKPRSAAKGGRYDPKTGRKVYEKTGATYYSKKTGRRIAKQTKVHRMDIANDAFELSSGTFIEGVYATHANKMKALGNNARKEMLATPNSKYNPSAKKAYKNEVDSLTHSLKLAKANKPRERKAQLMTETIMKEKLKENPSLSKEDVKKLRYKELLRQRRRFNSEHQDIKISPKEWEAIQAGAVSSETLRQIMANTNKDRLKEMAMPHTKPKMSPGKVALAKAKLASGYTLAEVAESLGVSTSTLSRAIK